MSVNKTEYDLGKIELKDFDVPVIHIEVKEPNSNIFGEIIGINEDDVLNLEIVLCTIEGYNKLVPLNVIKLTSRFFKFSNVLIGEYFILNKNSKELNLNSSNNIIQGEVVSFDTDYNFVNARFENYASLYNNWAIRLGGRNNGSATVQVYVAEEGEYDFNIEYLGANTALKIDVNGVNTGTIYRTPNQHQGYILIKLQLRRGNNEIKFYGDYPNVAPNLYKFMVQRTQITTNYNLINGILRNGCKIDRNLNMVTGLGGINRGEATVNVDAANAGQYGITIKYNKGLKSFLIDVNGINTGTNYATPTNRRGQYYLELKLTRGNNQLKFYGMGTKLAPDLGEFKIALIENPPEPPSSKYSVTKGILENGAMLNRSKKYVVNLGGPRNGSSTVTVDVAKAGNYNLQIEYLNGSRCLKIDVNKRTLNSTFMTPAGCYGYFTIVVNLRAGANEIKFHGITSEYSSNLGDFDLEFIKPAVVPILPPGTYGTDRGVFENGAELDVNTNFVKFLGGPNDGSTRLNINISNKGNYEIQIKYLCYDPNRFLSIDVNRVNIGIYKVDMTTGWTLSDVKIFTCSTLFNAGNNEIKFHGDKSNRAPMLGAFTLRQIPDPLPPPPPPPPPPPLPPPPPPPTVLPPYTFQKLNRLSYPNLVSLIKRIGWSDVPGLFEFSADSYTFFNDDNRVQAIIDELGRSGRSFTSSNLEGIETLVEFLRGGFYIAHGNTQLSRIYDIAYRDKCIPSILLVMNNSNFRFGNSVQNKAVQMIAKLIGNASASVQIVNLFANVLRDFKNNLASYSASREKTGIMYEILHNVNHFLDKEVHRNRYDATNTAFYDNIDPFLTEVEDLAQRGLNFAVGSEWLVNNFMYFASELSKFRRFNIITHRVLVNCLNIYPYLSRQYLEAIKEINRNFNSVLLDGTSIDYNGKMNEAKRRTCPNQYTFDDGHFIIKTGNSLSQDKVKKLYWASKEVKAQFMRILRADNALAVGNPDDILTVVIYNSPDEYKEYNNLLYGYSTDNGGIYIEQDGTFFTYDRTPQQSIYSLEELFRHEFVHYLEGRYLIPGLFGNGSFYTGNGYRLTWFAEGTAEFFAGATRKDNVQPRRAVVDELARNGRNRLSLSQLFRSDYSSFNFYKYGYAFSHYMYTIQLRQFLDFMRLIKSDDVIGFDDYTRTLERDRNTNSSYERTIDDLIANASNYSSPFTSDDYLIRHPAISTNQIQNDILNVIQIFNPTINTETSQFFETFIMRGIYDNGVSVDEISDWQSMNNRLNRVLASLERNPWSGYRTITAYFKNYRVNNNRHAIFDVVFCGVYRVY